MEYTGPTQTAEEALRLLRKYRKEVIIRGRSRAFIICIDEGTCHARRIQDEMRDEVRAFNDLHGCDVKWFWLGAVFNKQFEWTGEWHSVLPDPRTNHHGSEGIRIWRLKDDASR